eukprot:1250404-Pyramimonas_sp.AAC.1
MRTPHFVARPLEAATAPYSPLDTWQHLGNETHMINSTRHAARGSRIGAADTRIKSVQQLQGWRARRFQHGDLALAPLTKYY